MQTPPPQSSPVLPSTPLQFRPILKQTIWGGRQLGDVLGKPIGAEADYAESWEIVDHGADQSVVVEGPMAGTTLSEIVSSNPAWLFGKRAQEQTDQFPLLLKFLDCNRVLSVQVHPDDQYGAKMTVPDRGKTEAWYIIESQPESLVYAGLKPGVGRNELAEAIAVGQTESVLHSFHPQSGDCLFIPAGTVHALGQGLLVAEIQQSSNTTFRLFDWNRMGSDGKPRQLHIDESLDVTDYQSGPVAPSRTDRTKIGWQKLVTCDKFELHALEQGAGSFGGDDQFHIVTVPRGNCQLNGDFETIELTAGDSVLVPAAVAKCEISVAENSTALRMHL